MKLTNKTILLISPEPWDHIFVSKHHYATHLAKKKNSVYFLNPPSDKIDCKETEYKNVYNVNYKGYLKGLRFLPSILQRYFILKKFKFIEKLCGVQFDIIWSFDNSVFFDFSALPESIYSISHIVDLNQDFEFKKASKTADLCLSSSTSILEKQKKYNHNSHNIGHGYNKLAGQANQFKLKGNSNINCGYAGNLDIKYIDWNLIEKLVTNFPTIDFHFLGQWNYKEENLKLNSKPNFHYYGRVATDDLPSFYSKMDVLMILYQYEKYPQQLSNPHKMMEYLGSGKMVLATFTEEYQQLANEGIIKMTKSAKEYYIFLDEIVKDIGYWNRKKMCELRQSFANTKTYNFQIKKVENFIKI